MNTSKTKLAVIGLVALCATAGLRADDSASTGDANAQLAQMSQQLDALNNRVQSLEQKQGSASASPSGSSIEVHGFAEADYINDSTQSFNETVGDGAVKLGNTLQGQNGWTQFSERNTRIDVLGKTEVGSWLTKGYVEGDFLGYDPGPSYNATPGAAGGGNAATNNEYHFYTQPTFRLRHAYVDAKDSNTGFEFLTGQYWSLFGWNMDYVLSTVSEAPVTGILYERTPQLRLQETLGNSDWSLQLAADVEKPEQNTAVAPNVNEGIRFMLNDFKGRFAAATGAAKDMPLSLGISETNARYVWSNTTVPNANLTDSNVWASAVAVDGLLPIIPSSEDGCSLVLTGESTYGAGDTDGFNGGGFSGLSSLNAFNSAGIGSSVDSGVAGLDANGNFALVQLESWAGQLQFMMPASEGTIFTVGYGDLYSPNVFSLTKTPGFASNKVFNSDITMFANIMQDLTSSIRVGVEYDVFATNYLTGNGATGPETTAYDHRVEVSTWYRF